MGILDSNPLKRLPENLLEKGLQNKIKGLRLAQVQVIATGIGIYADIPELLELVDWTEDAQMNIEGVSRKQFSHVAENSGDRPIQNAFDSGKK